MRMGLSGLLHSLLRRKFVSLEYLQHSDWSRCLTLFELSALALAPGIGPGAFFFVPFAVKFASGPSTVIATVAVFISALFTGSIYTYAYVTFGEAIAYSVGWTMALSYYLAAALVTKQWSGHFDLLLNGTVHKALGYNFSSGSVTSVVSASIFDPTPDYLAMVGVTIVALICLLGTTVVSLVALVMESVALLILTSSIMVGFFYSNSENWSNDFFLNNAEGVGFASAVIVIAFVSLEFLTCFAEEASNPCRQFSSVINWSSTVCFGFCGLIAAIVSLVVPWNRLPSNRFLPMVYSMVSVPASKYVLTVGSVCYLSASSLCIGLPSARVLYAMSKDKLLCDCFGYISKKGVPRFNILIGFVLTVFIVCFDSRLLLNLLGAMLCLRFVLCNVCGILVSFCPQIVRIDPVDMTHYKRMRNNKGDSSQTTLSYSYISANGKYQTCHIPSELSTNFEALGSSDDDEEEEFNVMSSSYILRGIASASLDKVALDVGTSAAMQRTVAMAIGNGDCTGEATTKFEPEKLLEEATTIAKASGIDETRLSPAILHNCLKSPCSPHSSCAHIYEKSESTFPFAGKFRAANAEEPLCYQDVSQGFVVRLKCLLFLFALFSYLFSVTIFAYSNSTTESASLWLLVVVLLLTVVTTTVAGTLVKLARKQKPSTAALFCSLLRPLTAIALLQFFVASIEAAVWFHLLILLLFGLTVYFAYGIRNSQERNQQKPVHSESDDEETNIVNPYNQL